MHPLKAIKKAARLNPAASFSYLLSSDFLFIALQCFG